MDVLGIFRRGGIRETEALADFLDERATLLAQNTVDEYTKGRAGPIAATIFADAAFGAALERARREAYPIALTMLAQTVEGALRPHATDMPAEFLRALEGVVLSVFDRHPVPACLTPQAWLATRDDVLRWLDDLPRRRPKLPADITEPFAPLLLAIMPIHDMLRGENFPALQNYLRAALSGIHDEFVHQARPRALIAALLPRR
jgi:hypothetical protein